MMASLNPSFADVTDGTRDDINRPLATQNPLSESLSHWEQSRNPTMFLTKEDILLTFELH